MEPGDKTFKTPPFPIIFSYNHHYGGNKGHILNNTPPRTPFLLLLYSTPAAFLLCPWDGFIPFSLHTCVCFAHVCYNAQYTETPWHTHTHKKTQMHSHTRRNNHTLISDFDRCIEARCKCVTCVPYEATVHSPKARWLHHFSTICWQIHSCCPFRKPMWHQLFTAVMRLGPSADGPWCISPNIWLAFVYIHLSKAFDVAWFICMSIFCLSQRRFWTKSLEFINKYLSQATFIWDVHRGW